MAGTDENGGNYRAFVGKGGGFGLIPLRSDSGRLSFGFSALLRDSGAGSGAGGAGSDGAGLVVGGCRGWWICAGFGAGRLSVGAVAARPVLCCLLRCVLLVGCRAVLAVLCADHGRGADGISWSERIGGNADGDGIGKSWGRGCRRIAARLSLAIAPGAVGFIPRARSAPGLSRLRLIPAGESGR